MVTVLLDGRTGETCLTVGVPPALDELWRMFAKLLTACVPLLLLLLPLLLLWL